MLKLVPKDVQFVFCTRTPGGRVKQGEKFSLWFNWGAGCLARGKHQPGHTLPLSPGGSLFVTMPYRPAEALSRPQQASWLAGWQSTRKEHKINKGHPPELGTWQEVGMRCPCQIDQVAVSKTQSSCVWGWGVNLISGPSHHPHTTLSSKLKATPLGQT